MASSKLLQQPSIISIIGSSLRIAHPDISGYKRTGLSSSIAAAGTTMSVLDNNGFEDDDYFVIGELGDNETEEGDVNGAVTRGTSLTVTNSLKFGHAGDVPITRILERGIKIYGAATIGGSGTLIASVDAITTPIADAVAMQWDKPYTEYNLISTDTTYAYYFVKYTDGTTDSDASDYIPAAGLPSNSIEVFIQKALTMTNSELKFRDKITREKCVEWADECQEKVKQYSFKDPRTGITDVMNWDFEIKLDETILLTENENRYALAALNLKYPTLDKSVISVRLGNSKPLTKLPLKEFDDQMAEKPRTEVATQASAGDTSLVVDSNVEFGAEGTFYLGSDTVTYTGKTGTTTFTGIPASGSGAITATRVVDSAVWQNVAPALPDNYTVISNYIQLDAPVDALYVDYKIRLRFFKDLTALTRPSNTTEVTFINIFPLFIAARIEKTKGNEKKAATLMGEFEGILLINANQNKVLTEDHSTYYNFSLKDNNPIDNFL